MTSGAGVGPDFEGLSAEEAFATLGNEVRLDIVRALWQSNAAREYDDADEAATTLPFSALRRRVDVRDNGRFNYHLSKLVPQFVRRTEDGYRLSGAGKRIARTVIAVSGPEFEFSTEIGADCPLCGSPLQVEYEDQWLRVRCTECAGLFGDDAPCGTVYSAGYPAAGVADRSAEEALENGIHQCLLDNAGMMRGLCRECGGRVSGSVIRRGQPPAPRSTAPETGAASPDGGDGTRFDVWAEQRCETCRFAKRLPVELFVLGLTPVLSFLDDRFGVDGLGDPFNDIVGVVLQSAHTAVAEDPLRVSVSFIDGEEALTVTLDEQVRPVEVDAPG